MGPLVQKNFKAEKCKPQLGQAITRMNIHRQKKVNQVAKRKDEICTHLNSQNEVNAKIWTETLINDEGLIPCYDIASTMCDQIKGRLEYIAKFGPPQDMTQSFATLIHVAPKLQVEELMEVRKQLTVLLGKEFVEQADGDKKMINPLVAENIDFKKPMDGEVIYRMKELAKERNIQYTPSMDMQQALNSYMDLKGKMDPMDVQGEAIQPLTAPPQYNPGPGGFNPDLPPGNDNSSYPPPSFPPGGPGGNVPQYMPQGPPQYQPQVPPQGYQMPPPQSFQPPPQVYQPPPPGMPMYNPPGGDVATGMPVQPGGHDIGFPSIPTGPPGGGEAKQNNDNLDDLEARLRALDGK